MRGHPLAWAGWLGAVTVLAVAVTNPIYIAAGIGAVLLVHLAAPPDPAAGRAVPVFLVLGLAFLALRVLLAVFLPVRQPGGTTLLTLPALELPRWLGGISLLGDVTAEVLAYSAVDSLRLVLVLVAFGVFNARVDLASTIRLVPPAFRDAGLVVSIAAAFVPGMLRAARDVRDAQRLRGERGIRALAPSLAVPVLGIALERAFLLAESMDARGYGQTQPAPGARPARIAGLVLCGGAVALWLAAAATAAGLVALGGGALLTWGVWAAGKGARVTRLTLPRWKAPDTAVLLAAAAAAALAAAAGPGAVYDPHPAIHPPGFSWTLVVPAALLAAPVAADLLDGARSGSRPLSPEGAR